MLAVGIAIEITDPEELAAARRLRFSPLARGERTHFVRIRPEFVSGRRPLRDPEAQDGTFGPIRTGPPEGTMPR